MDEEIGDKLGMAINSCNIANVYSLQKNYTMAIDYMLRSLKIAGEIEYKRGVAINTGNIGDTYLLIYKDTSTRSPNVTNAIELSVNKYQATGAIPTGKTALLSNAIDYLQQSLVMCKELHIIDVMQDVYENLAEAYKIKGDYKKAMEYADDARQSKTPFSQNRMAIR